MGLNVFIGFRLGLVRLVREVFCLRGSVRVFFSESLKP